MGTFETSRIMKSYLLFIFFPMLMSNQTLFDFTKEANISAWRVVDDVVMGGRSSGSFYLSPEGHGVFEGQVSLENNGGFSSVRYNFSKISTSPNDILQIKLKGDGKAYQVRIKDRSDRYYSYIISFPTSGNWEVVELKLSDMYPSFRGRKLDEPNFGHQQIEELTFLIANKKPEKFKLVLDEITLRPNP
jgi:hypothetical protein